MLVKKMILPILTIKKNKIMAGAAGFEPANVDSKNRCSTKWLCPIAEYLGLFF